MILSLKVYHHRNAEKLVLLYTPLSSLNKTIPYDSLVFYCKDASPLCCRKYLLDPCCSWASWRTHLIFPIIWYYVSSGGGCLFRFSALGKLTWESFHKEIYYNRIVSISNLTARKSSCCKAQRRLWLFKLSQKPTTIELNYLVWGANELFCREREW